MVMFTPKKILLYQPPSFGLLAALPASWMSTTVLLSHLPLLMLRVNCPMMTLPLHSPTNSMLDGRHAPRRYSSYSCIYRENKTVESWHFCSRTSTGGGSYTIGSGVAAVSSSWVKSMEGKWEVFAFSKIWKLLSWYWYLFFDFFGRDVGARSMEYRAPTFVFEMPWLEMTSLKSLYPWCVLLLYFNVCLWLLKNR